MTSIGGAAAHSPNESGVWHQLTDHLREVGDAAARFANAFGMDDVARWAGRWHDIGKATSGFQDYILACSVDSATAKAQWAPHKMAGAVHAWQSRLAPVALAIAGHHGGMPNLGELRSIVSVEAALAHTQEALAALASESWLALDRPVNELEATFGLTGGSSPGGKRELEVLTRFLFSCLVDADFLDTEQHFNLCRASSRSSTSIGFEALERRMTQALPASVAERSADSVAADRGALYQGVVGRSAEARGLFTLTAPTGSGKTIAALGFAMAHARRHDLRRLVVATPFVSITEQTAGVYRSLLDLPDDSPVLEHHSSPRSDEDDESTARAVSKRLATENWDAEVVVTTTVQLLDSLFSNRPAACRKLHRLARSVIVIDEAQSIPFGLLDPTLDVLRQLCERLGSSVVLSTATQPPFARLPSMSATTITELVDDPVAWSARFARVSVDYRRDPMDWDVLADLVTTEAAAHGDQCLVVLNTIDDASTLTRSLVGTPGLVYLSTRLCPAHRRRILGEVRQRLAAGEGCVLVSTQVVEAGVDVSFPVGVRAIGPAIALAQVAGRVNRNGERERGRLVVVDPTEGHCPPGDYRLGRDIARDLLREGVDVLGEPGVREYYERLFINLNDNVDGKNIQAMRKALAFADVAAAYRVIDEESVSVFVDYGPSGAELDAARSMPARWAMRRLQPYLVSLRRKVADDLRNAGLIVPIRGFGLVEHWSGQYDELLGLQTTTPSEEW